MRHSVLTILLLLLPPAVHAADPQPALDSVVKDLAARDGRTLNNALTTLETMLNEDKAPDKAHFAPAVKPLMSRLGNGGPELFMGLRAEALLARIGKPALPAILDKIGSKNNSMGRAACIRLLVKLDPGKAVEILPDLLIDREIRRDVLVGLGQLGPAAKAAVPRVEDSFDDPDAITRIHARGAIIRITGKTAPHIDILVNMALNPEVEGQYRDQSIGELWSLGDAGRDSYPLFIKAFKNSDPAIRKLSVHAFHWKGPQAPEIVAGLVDVFQHDADASIRRSAAGALLTFGPAAKAAVPALIKALESDPENGSIYVNTLCYIGSDEALPAVLRALDSPHDQIRMTVASCLSVFRAHADQIIPVLEKHASDPNEKFRSSVRSSISILKQAPAKSDR